LGGLSDQKDMEETMYMTGDYYAMAQLAFYYKKYSDGIEFLKTGISENSPKECALALFDIYYYGLFDQPVQLENAKIIYGVYIKSK